MRRETLEGRRHLVLGRVRPFVGRLVHALRCPRRVDERRVHRHGFASSPKPRQDLAVDLGMVGMAIELGVCIDVGRLSKLEQVVDVSCQVCRTQQRVSPVQEVAEVAVAPPPTSSGRIGVVETRAIARPRRFRARDRLQAVIRVAEQEDVGRPWIPTKAQAEMRQGIDRLAPAADSEPRNASRPPGAGPAEAERRSPPRGVVPVRHNRDTDSTAHRSGLRNDAGKAQRLVVRVGDDNEQRAAFALASHGEWTAAVTVRSRSRGAEGCGDRPKLAPREREDRTCVDRDAPEDENRKLDPGGEPAGRDLDREKSSGSGTERGARRSTFAINLRIGTWRILRRASKPARPKLRRRALQPPPT
jgi:hypothetical protein